MIIYDKSLELQIKKNFEFHGKIATAESVSAHIQYMAGHIYGVYNYTYMLNESSVENIYNMSISESKVGDVKIVNDIHKQHVGTPQGLLEVYHFDVITTNDNIKHHIYLIYQPLVLQPYPYYIQVSKN